MRRNYFLLYFNAYGVSRKIDEGKGRLRRNQIMGIVTRQAAYNILCRVANPLRSISLIRIHYAISYLGIWIRFRSYRKPNERVQKVEKGSSSLNTYLIKWHACISQHEMCCVPSSLKLWRKIALQYWEASFELLATIRYCTIISN